MSSAFDRLVWYFSLPLKGIKLEALASSGLAVRTCIFWMQTASIALGIDFEPT
jgi:hypothetical protein